MRTEKSSSGIGIIGGAADDVGNLIYYMRPHL
jgi:hypothetical protein